MRLRISCRVLLLAGFLILSCEKSNPPETGPPSITTVPNGSSGYLTVDLELDPSVYRLSRFGEPPQIAVWIEYPQLNELQNLWISHRSAKGEWLGKVECKTALPFWNRRMKELNPQKTPPSFLNPLMDAVSGATPVHQLHVPKIPVKEGKIIMYVEVNCSADFNTTYSTTLANGSPDQEGNGQPSLVYACELLPESGQICEPELIGRTSQSYNKGILIDELRSVTSAKALIQSIRVKID